MEPAVDYGHGTEILELLLKEWAVEVQGGQGDGRCGAAEHTRGQAGENTRLINHTY